MVRTDRWTVVLEATGEGTTDKGERFCLPGVSDAAFMTFPNGDAGLRFENPEGDDLEENLRFVSIIEVREGIEPGNVPQFHANGPVSGGRA